MYTPGKYYQQHKVEIGDLFTHESNRYVVIPGAVANEINSECTGDENIYIFASRVGRTIGETKFGKDVNGFPGCYMFDIIRAKDQKFPKVYSDNGLIYGCPVKLQDGLESHGEEVMVVSKIVELACNGKDRYLHSSQRISCYCPDRNSMYMPVIQYSPENLGIFKAISESQYPHTCSRCNHPAFDMQVTIYCSNPECKLYHV